jgi:hypothetical protein
MSYCPDHDPILHATNVVCGECGATSYPVDAEWIGPALVLATFVPKHEPGCPWRGFPETVLLDLGQDDLSIPSPPERSRRRCRRTAITTGQQCRHYALYGSAFCRQHDPQRREAS